MDVNFPNLEEEVLKKWRTEKTFQRSLLRRKKSPRFVFYDGPPTANAGPGLHHVANRVFKDVILRYKTMQGFFAPRKAGWDTHGLPVELQIEKKLGLKSKKDIERYGIAKFNQECKKSVWEYKGEWEKFNERLGLWLDMDHPYITYDTSYIESLWFIIKRFWDKGLLYKDYKVVPYCARCGTPLSSHELAQGYRTVKDRSVYAKFKITGNSKFQGAHFLAWTTTPWTLPGNVALAVNVEKSYIVAEQNEKKYILAKELASKVLGEYRTLQTFKGKDLLGIRYDPLFHFKEPESGKKVWEVVPADFVSMEEGTGVVHTAVAYGEDDFKLGKKENLAMLHLVNEEGKFDKGTWSSMFVKDADPLIIADLKQRNLLFKEELYEHEYPFCWRCSTPLLYYAKESWFLNMQKVKKNLIANNNTINWIPSHIKKGRMGEWLKEVKDWAFSRERYWGTPLPVWQCRECKNTEVVGSLDELKSKKFTTNSYYILRHGHSEKQVANDVMACWPEKIPYHLTEKGRAQVAKSAKELKKKKIGMIFSSDLMRTKETAEILGKELGIQPVFDARLREWDVGILNGKPLNEFGKIYGRPEETKLEHYLRRFTEPAPQGESWQDMQRRMYGFLKEINQKHSSKNIVIISHQDPLLMLETMVQGFSREEIVEYLKGKKKGLATGTWRELPFALLPYNDQMELDLHRPYVDEVVFSCSKCLKGTMQRVKEVVDVWYDSGAMPFAQGHWPFAENPKSEIQNPKPPAFFPADYIVEAIDQTRGWFYTLLAVSTLLGFKSPYKNVISLGHVLDAKGEKMSKSKGNIVDPWNIAKTYGVDASRWYFYSFNNPGDPKLFSEKDIQEVTRRFMLTLWNCFVFFETYAAKSGQKKRIVKNKNALDQWILSRLASAVKEISLNLDAYDITRAARRLEDFTVQDLSLWYIRRSRSRFQNPQSKEDLLEVSEVLKLVLETTAKLCAPFMPFLSEQLFENLGSAKESVHLQDWPKPGKQDKTLEHQMEQAREIVAKALAERAKASIRVRQPLAQLRVKKEQKIAKDILELIQQEVNVKEVVFDPGIKEEVQLDTAITSQLREEGMAREIMRKIQDMRKEAGYQPKDKISLWYTGDKEIARAFLAYENQIKQAVGIVALQQGTAHKPECDNEAQLSFE
ncbi:MAG: class I tRNA ligase family protein, partial [Candidatus Wildermuthbacteria bacterium]|nr:class I tRNA ligase family protein [Candidatus Wildermuthbacteria bacterium]